MNNDSRLLSEAYKTIVEQNPQLGQFRQDVPTYNIQQMSQAFGLNPDQEKAVKNLLQAFNINPDNPQASQRAIIGMIINGLARLAQTAVNQPVQQAQPQQTSAQIAPVGGQPQSAPVSAGFRTITPE